VKVKGRIASLLEVGTGFHPELTGRENIYLNGAILGMRKHEITRKLDEIIDFAGVERYIDTPVKRYSSGMYVRLAFGVAAHLESEILIIDEVLAVGDAEFQKKCLGKMSEVSKGEGRTVLFVSHNMAAVKKLCKNGLLLNLGRTELNADVEQAVNAYLKEDNLKSFSYLNYKSDKIEFVSISIADNGMPGGFNIDENLTFVIVYKVIKSSITLNINLFFKTADGQIVFVTTSSPQKHASGEYVAKCEIPSNIMNDIEYSIDLMAVENSDTVLVLMENCQYISGQEPNRKGSWFGKYPGLVRPTNFPWHINKYNNGI
jgi:lipopolysaccharide transport system ATP-binding protein